MLAYDFYPSEGGIQTFMHSLVTVDIGIDWTVLTREVDGTLPYQKAHANWFER